MSRFKKIFRSLLAVFMALLLIGSTAPTLTYASEIVITEEEGFNILSFFANLIADFYKFISGIVNFFGGGMKGNIFEEEIQAHEVATESELRDALAAGGEVYLLNSIVCDDLTTIEIPAGIEVTLYLKHFSVTNEVANAPAVTVLGDLTVMGDGAIKNGSSEDGSVTIENFGKLYVAGGIIGTAYVKNDPENNPGSAGAAVKNHGTATLVGGTFASGMADTAEPSYSDFVFVNMAGTMVIYEDVSARADGNSHGLFACYDGIVTVYGGTYYIDYSDTSDKYAAFAAKNAEIYFYGGKVYATNKPDNKHIFIVETEKRDVFDHEAVDTDNITYVNCEVYNNKDRLYFGEGMYVPDPEGSFPVYTIAELQAAVEAEEKLIVIKDYLEITCAEDAIVIPANANIKIYGRGFIIKRAEGAEAVSMFTVSEGATLTLESIVLDGGAVWTGETDPVLLRGTTNSGVATTGASTIGVIVETANNANVVIENGAVLQNNDGAYAVNLGTRIGATLTLNGGEIINNNSEAGAIWGGGHITINDGKINSNSATGSAGAIRMVSSCNLTMKGGEMNHNKAAANGGAIWGYGASTYNLSGGEIAYNNGVVGGAIYTGDSSVIYISGDFEFHHNSTENDSTAGGAIRFTNRTTLNMSGGKIYDNESNGFEDAFYGWNLAANITGGEIADDFMLASGLYCTFGAAEITGVVHFALNTGHNTALLTKDFNGFSFTVATGDNFANFNLKPADGYEYSEGDEEKLICMNEGYETYWDAAKGVFKLKVAE